MTTLRFDGPDHRLRWNGLLIPRGTTFSASEAEAQSLLRCAPQVIVTVIEPPKARRKPEAPEGEGQTDDATPAEAEDTDDTRAEEA